MKEFSPEEIEIIAKRLKEVKVQLCSATKKWLADPRRILVVHDMDDNTIIVTCLHRSDGAPPPPIYQTLGICE